MTGGRVVVVPLPTTLETGGEPFVVSGATVIEAGSGIDNPAADVGVRQIAEQLAAHLQSATGHRVAVRDGGPGQRAGRPGEAVTLSLGGDPELGNEGYELSSTPAEVSIRAHAPAGLFYGIQTLRQVLDGGEVPGMRVRDLPRYAWRGVMLDIARHFFGVAEIKRFIDLISLYKINVLHLHLTDDQGWRLEITRRPDLTRISGRSQVGEGAGGYLSQDDYAEIVAYAAARQVMVVPEIDMPGHVQAAMVAYPELAPEGVVPQPYAGTDVGFSSLSIRSPATRAFVQDVLTEIAQLTPGRYVHIGGDEALTTEHEEYATFVRTVMSIVRAAGKSPIGWQEIAEAGDLDGALVQYWKPDRPDQAVAAARAGARLIMSPADRVYLDMKYDENWRLGTGWAGHSDVRQAYDWDPEALVEGLEGVSEAAIAGVEAALWTETIATMADIEVMTFPRLPAVAEVGWSAPERRDWDDFRARLGAQARLWAAMEIDFYRSPQIPWAG